MIELIPLAMLEPPDIYRVNYARSNQWLHEYELKRDYTPALLRLEYSGKVYLVTAYSKLGFYIRWEDYADICTRR